MEGLLLERGNKERTPTVSLKVKNGGLGYEKAAGLTDKEQRQKVAVVAIGAKPYRPPRGPAVSFLLQGYRTDSFRKRKIR